MMGVSANPRQLFAGQPIDNPAAAERGRHLHEIVVVGDHLADHCRVASQRMAAHGRQHLPGRCGRHDGDELAFILHIERIEPEEVAGSDDFRLHWDRILDDAEAYIRLVREFVERRR